MRDLTKDSVVWHLLSTAAPVALTMIVQMVYQLIDLYFVAQLGAEAIAGVNAAGNTIFIVNALSQVLIVGTVSLVAHAIGRRDARDANLIFNQSMTLSIVCGIAMSVLIYAFIGQYMRSIAADAATVDAGITFVRWILPGFALLLPMGVLSCTLRAIGLVKPSLAAYALTVAINVILAPVLIAGWGTGQPLGVMGAGLATSLSVVAGVIFLAARFHRSQGRMLLAATLMRPHFGQWRRLLSIGLPAGGEFTVTFLCMAVVYYAIRDFGAAAQAGVGIGARILQTISVPAMAIALAAAPLAGQNFAASNASRVRDTFRTTALIGATLMAAITGIVQWWPTALVRLFDADAAANAVAISFLRGMSWALAAQAIVYTCSSMFQALGNTVPALMGSAIRFLIFTIPVVYLAAQPNFRIEQVWYLLVAAVVLQAGASLCLLRVEFEKRVLPLEQQRGLERATSAPSLGN